MTERNVFHPDIIIEDDYGVPIVIVEVRHTVHETDRSFFHDRLAQYVDRVRRAKTEMFTILADRETIEVFRGAPGESEPVRVPTSLLGAYDSGYPARSQHSEYLIGLIEAWLDDLAHHWHSNPAPHEEHVPPGLPEALRAA